MCRFLIIAAPTALVLAIVAGQAHRGRIPDSPSRDSPASSPALFEFPASPGFVPKLVPALKREPLFDGADVSAANSVPPSVPTSATKQRRHQGLRRPHHAEPAAPVPPGSEVTAPINPSLRDLKDPFR